MTKLTRQLFYMAANCRHALGGVAVVALLSSCGPSYIAPPVTPELVKISRARESVSILSRGYEVHQAKCAKCHSYEDPAKYPAAELTEEIMPEMARKSKIDSADEKAVLAYLLAARQMPPAVKP
jgi:hypothetical protein